MVNLNESDSNLNKKDTNKKNDILKDGDNKQKEQKPQSSYGYLKDTLKYYYNVTKYHLSDHMNYTW